MDLQTLVIILLVVVIIELVWILRLHSRMKECCEWLEEFHEAVVKTVTICCGGNVDPTWPPDGPPSA